jgi:hypothetical protein
VRTDLALEVARPMTSALPWMTSASGAEIGSLDGSGESWWSVWSSNGGSAPGGSRDKGRRQVSSAQNLRRVTHGSSDPSRWAGDDGGPALLNIDV